MSAIFALCAAFSNALYVSDAARREHERPRRARRRACDSSRISSAARCGCSAGRPQLGAFVFQAAALKNGQLSIVQALLVTELVFGLLLRKIWIRPGDTSRRMGLGRAHLRRARRVRRRRPAAGRRPTPTAHAWAGVLATFGGAAAVMTLAARWGSPRRRAALYAAAAAIVWALVATFIKTATETLTESGVAAVFTHWPVYALAAGGAAGVVLVQAALHVGPLSVSQPLLVIVDPSVSVILSAWLFQERYTRGPGASPAALLAFAVMCGRGRGAHEDRAADDAGRTVPMKLTRRDETDGCRSEVGLRAARLVLGLVVFVLIGWAAGALWTAVVGSGELQVIRDIADERSPGVTAAAKVVTWAGSAYVLVPLALICCPVLYRAGLRREALAVALSLAGAMLISDAIKLLVSRPRPGVEHLQAVTGSSFPSGHATQASAFWFSLVLALRAARVAPRRVRLATGLAIALVLAVALSRVYLGVHYPADVIAGILLGTAWAMFVAGSLRTEARPAGRR